MYEALLQSRQILIHIAQYNNSMTSMQGNPFHKPNPYHVYKYNKFNHPHLKEEYSSISIRDVTRPQQAIILENNWIFHENNLSKRVDFTKKTDTSLSQVSQFELKVKMSSVNVPQSVNAKLHNYDTKLENPFYRKNLLVNQQQVKNMVEMDVSLYRNKSRSAYEPAPLDTGQRRSYLKLANSNAGNGLGMVINKNSPYDSDEADPPFNTKDQGSNEKQLRFLRPVEEMVVSQYVRDSPMANNTLTYSKTPQITQRINENKIEYVDLDPKFISYNNKKYYLNNVNLIFS